MLTQTKERERDFGGTFSQVKSPNNPSTDAMMQRARMLKSKTTNLDEEMPRNRDVSPGSRPYSRHSPHNQSKSDLRSELEGNALEESKGTHRRSTNFLNLGRDKSPQRDPSPNRYQPSGATKTTSTGFFGNLFTSKSQKKSSNNMIGRGVNETQNERSISGEDVERVQTIGNDIQSKSQGQPHFLNSQMTA